MKNNTTMKHTDFYEKVKVIKQQEYTELQKAVEAHGGFYQWDEDNAPIIAVSVDGCNPNPDDIEVTKVAVVNGYLELWGVDKEYRNPVDFTTNDVFAGHLSYIIDSIPITDKVSDVSISLKDAPFIPKVGDNVWIFNKDRRDKVNDRYGEITKIGKKYFYVRTGVHSETRFEISTLAHDNGECSPRYELYPSQEICEFHKDAEKKKHVLSDSLLMYLTDEEATSLYNALIQRAK